MSALATPESCEMLVRYCDDLAKRNSEALSFIPRPRLLEYAMRGQILAEYENGDLCGFAVIGRGSDWLHVYQCCIQYDARRIYHGLNLVAQIEAVAMTRGLQGISLRCADDLPANAFWLAAGFEKVAVLPGGVRRGRTINVWQRTLVSLFTSKAAGVE